MPEEPMRSRGRHPGPHKFKCLRAEINPVLDYITKQMVIIDWSRFPTVKANAQRFVVAVLAAAVLMGCASAPPAIPPHSPLSGPVFSGEAIVRSVHGNVTYATNGEFRRLRTNMQLPAGTTVKTDEGAEAYLQVNGYTSTIKLSEKSTLELTKMDRSSSKEKADTQTVLTLKSGNVQWSVRKLSAPSYYEIYTPDGVAAVRGTDFGITADPLPDGKSQVTYRVVTGQLAVTAVVDGKEVTQILQTGQYWVPGEGDIRSAPATVPYGDVVPIVVVLPPSSPPNLIQPFHGAGAPNTAVDVGMNPYGNPRSSHGVIIRTLPIRTPPPPPRPPTPPAVHR